MVFYTSHRLLQLISGSYDGIVCNNAALLWINPAWTTHSPEIDMGVHPFIKNILIVLQTPMLFQGKTHTLHLTVLKAAGQQQTLQMQDELCRTFNKDHSTDLEKLYIIYTIHAKQQIDQKQILFQLTCGFSRLINTWIQTASI